MSSGGPSKPKIPTPTPVPQSVEEQEKFARDFELERRRKAVGRANTIMTSREGTLLGQ